MTSLVFKLDMVQTLALAAVVLFFGYAIRRRIGVLDRYNIPAPVVGGFLFAASRWPCGCGASWRSSSTRRSRRPS